MNKIIIAILLTVNPILISNCTKHYTNEDCINDFKNDKKEGYESLSRLDKSYFEIGVSLECAKYNNDPKEVRKHLTEDEKND